jgi:succinate-semialdehyde dehydrogenase/glutarate-semialdehyde dehydrogenase
MTTTDDDLLTDLAYVGGSWTGADDGSTFPVTNPATGEELARVPRMGAVETRRAIAAAERALPAWRAAPAKERARILRRLADLMLERQDARRTSRG